MFFDALGSDRCYKNAWNEEDIRDFFIAQRGIKFEPKLVDIVIDNFEEFTAVRAQLPDDA